MPKEYVSNLVVNMNTKAVGNLSHKTGHATFFPGNEYIPCPLNLKL